MRASFSNLGKAWPGQASKGRRPLSDCKESSDTPVGKTSMRHKKKCQFERKRQYQVIKYGWRKETTERRWEKSVRVREWLEFHSEKTGLFGWVPWIHQRVLSKGVAKWDLCFRKSALCLWRRWMGLACIQALGSQSFLPGVYSLSDKCDDLFTDPSTNVAHIFLPLPYRCPPGTHFLEQ